MLAVVHQGIAVPIFWILLNKRGNSNTKERIALIQRFIKVFGKSSIRSILADREFIGNEWFSWLDGQKISFCIRIKKDTKILNRKGESIQIQKIFWNLKYGSKPVYTRRLMVLGVPIYASALRLKDGELLIVASNRIDNNAVGYYGKRWEIETLFSCLKGRGFDLEATRLTKRSRVKKLLAVHAIAFCWAYHIGIWQHAKTPIKIKSHGRLEKSIFRLGLDLLQEALKETFVFNRHSKISKYINMLADYFLRE